MIEQIEVEMGFDMYITKGVCVTHSYDVQLYLLENNILCIGSGIV